MTKRQVESPAVVVGRAFVKALNGFRFYSAGHPALTELLTKFGEQLRGLLVDSGELSMVVAGEALEVDGVDVLANQDATMSWTRPLAVCGVRKLTVMRDASDSAIQQLMSTWYAAVQHALPEGYDFFSAVWESAPEGVELDAPSLTLRDCGLDAEAVGKREQEFVAMATSTAAGEGPTGDAAAWLRTLRVSASSTAPGPTGVVDGEVEALRQALKREGTGTQELGILVVWWLLADAVPAEEQALFGLLNAALQKTIELEDWGALHRAFQVFVADCKRVLGLRTFLVSACQAVLLEHQPAVLKALEKPATQADVLHVLRSFPLSLNDALVRAALSASPSTRAQLIGLYAERSRTLQALCQMVGGLRMEDGQLLAGLLAKHHDRERLAEALLECTDDGLCSVAVQHLPASSRAEAAAQRLLASVDAKALAVALRYVGKNEATRLTKHVIALLGDRRPEVVAEAVACLGALPNREASNALLHIAEASTQPEGVRVAAINGVGAIGDPLSRDALKQLGSGWRTPAAVRTAVKVALSRVGGAG